MSLRRQLLWLVAMFAVLAFVAAACSDDNGGGGDETPSGDETPMDNGGDLQTDHGVSDTEIKLGMTLAQSGNPSAAGYVSISTAIDAYFDKLNAEDNGVCERDINLTLVDDQYSPAISLQEATRLAVQEDVLAFIGNLGTPAVEGQIDYINDPNGDGDTSDGIPHLYLSTGASKWDDPERWPWTVGYIPDYTFEGNVLGRVANANFSGQTVGALYQNDDFGENGLDGFKETFEGEVVAEESYEATAAEITSELANLRDADPDVLYLYSLPLITAQAFQYMKANDWAPQVFWSYVNAPTLIGALAGGEDGPEAGYAQIAGTVSTNYLLDPIADVETPELVEHGRIMQEYGDIDVSSLTVYGQSLAQLAEQTLRDACDSGDMTRAGVLAAAEGIEGYHGDLHLAGIEINVGPDDHFAIQTLQPVEVQDDGSLMPLGDPETAE